MDQRSTHRPQACPPGLHGELDAVAQRSLLTSDAAFPGSAARLLPPSKPTPELPRKPVPRPPASLQVRADGVRVMEAPALLAGVRLGPCCRLDVHPVPGGLVYVMRGLVLTPLGDDERGEVFVGVVPAAEVDRFWEHALAGRDPRDPVIVHLGSEEAAQTVRLLTAVGPPGLNVVGYRLDESADGTQRSSYLLPEVVPQAVAELDERRLRLADAPESVTGAGEAEAGTHWKPVHRYLQRVMPEVLHSLDRRTPALASEVFVDGATLRGARLGGAAATAGPEIWAARALPGATRPVEAELEGLLLGHAVAAWAGRTEAPVVIRSDSRAALALLRDAVAAPLTLGEARGDRVRTTLRHLLELREQMATAGRSVRLRWIKGHAGHPGNERADALARSVARNTLVGTHREEHRFRLQRIARSWADPADAH